jgi:hypothetical protein
LSNSPSKSMISSLQKYPGIDFSSI